MPVCRDVMTSVADSCTGNADGLVGGLGDGRLPIGFKAQVAEGPHQLAGEHVDEPDLRPPQEHEAAVLEGLLEVLLVLRLDVLTSS
jgi:hypothetical protein